MMSEVSLPAQNRTSSAELFGLVDAAVDPERIFPLLTQSGEVFHSVYAGLPEEEAGPASLFLVRISDPRADWIMELDRIDLYKPCLSLIWSRVDVASMATHLQAFLFADIGDNMTAMVRYFDPRNVEAMLAAWGTQVRGMFTAPLEQWLYRGRHPDWQRIRNDEPADTRICRSIVIRLNQSDVDAVTSHTEPDEILSNLIDIGTIDGDRPYAERFAEFIPRYRQALHWKIEEPADRMVFCQYTYLYGETFDRHPFISDLLLKAKRTGESFGSLMSMVPAGVWIQIDHARKYQSTTS